MARIPDETIESIRERVDIADLIGKHVGLRKSGRQFVGLCPFHGERTPSFYVYPEGRNYKCYGCGVWGDAFDFVQKVHGVGFYEAIRMLAAQAGVALPEQSAADVARSERKLAEREAGFRLNALAVEVYSKVLASPAGAAARAYLEGRGVTAQTAEDMQLGYAPHPTEGGWDTLASAITSSGLPMDIAETLGLVSKSERTGNLFDRFRGRVMFPIVQPGGTVAAFSGRILPDHELDEDGRKAPKYMNSPESVLFRKRETLYGLDSAGRAIKEAGRAILVEGNLDVVSMHQRGYRETVAPLGTSLTEQQCEKLAKFTDRVVVCFDGDRAGATAAYKALKMLLEFGMDVRIVALPEGEDPDSTEPEHLAALLKRPGAAIEWVMKRMVQAGAGATIESRAKALASLARLLVRLRNRHAVTDYADLAANLLGIPRDRMLAAVESLARGHATRGPNRQRMGAPGAPEGHFAPGSARGSEGPGSVDSAATRPLAPLPRGQRTLTALLVDRPEVATHAEKAGVMDIVTDSRLAPIVREIIHAARSNEPMPHVGALLEHVDPRAHAQLRDRVFVEQFRDPEVDTNAVLAEGLKLCQQEQLEREIRELDVRSQKAREAGDQRALRELQQEKIALRRAQAELRDALSFD